MREGRQKRINAVQFQLYHIARDYLMNQLDKSFSVPEYLQQNSQRWVGLFLGQKKIQAIFLDFHARLDQLFKTELKANRQQL